MGILGVALLALIAGAGIGGAMTYFLIMRPLVKEVLLMKREGFVTYPKIIKPPTSPTPEYLEFRED